jgi:hypothetical protein
VTLVEFVAPLNGGVHRDKVLAVLCHDKWHRGVDGMTADLIASRVRDARVTKAAKINVPDVLAKSGHYVEVGGGRDGKHRVWRITGSGERHVRRLLALPEVDAESQNDVSALVLLAQKVNNADVRSYIEEAITCLRAGALRAAVVFLWSGAVRTIQDRCLYAGVPALNGALVRHDPKTRTVTKIEDFAYIKDSATLLAAQDVGVLDKTQKTILGHALDLRNGCGHPSKYTLGAKKVSSFIEDVTGIVFASQ